MGGGWWHGVRFVPRPRGAGVGFRRRRLSAPHGGAHTGTRRNGGVYAADGGARDRVPGRAVPLSSSADGVEEVLGESTFRWGDTTGTGGPRSAETADPGEGEAAEVADQGGRTTYGAGEEEAEGTWED